MSRLTSMAVVGLIAGCGSALATGLQPASAPAEAVKLLAAYCIDTDAQAARAEAAVTALRLAPEAVKLRRIDGGVSLSLALGGGVQVELDIEAGGRVRACGLAARITDPAATFVAMQQRFQIGGALDDYEPGNKIWTDTTSPGGAALAVHVTISSANSLDGGGGGTLSAVVMPAGR